MAAVRSVVDAGVAVMGHVGLTPQSISVLGGFRPQGRSAHDALQIVHDAKVWEAVLHERFSQLITSLNLSDGDHSVIVQAHFASRL